MFGNSFTFFPMHFNPNWVWRSNFFVISPFINIEKNANRISMRINSITFGYWWPCLAANVAIMFSFGLSLVYPLPKTKKKWIFLSKKKGTEEINYLLMFVELSWPTIQFSEKESITCFVNKMVLYKTESKTTKVSFFIFHTFQFSH